MTSINVNSFDARIDPSALKWQALHTPLSRTRPAESMVLALLDLLAAATGAGTLLLLDGSLGRVTAIALAALLVLWPMTMHAEDARHANLFTHGRVPLGRLARSTFRAAVVLGFAVWVVGAPAQVHHVAGAVLVTAVATATTRALWRRVRGPRRILVVGQGERAAHLVERLVDLNARDVVLHDAGEATVTSVAERASRDDIDDVVAVGCAGLADADLRRLGWLLEQRHQCLHVATGLLGIGSHRVQVESSGAFSVIGVRPSETAGARRVLWNLGGRLVAAVLLVAVLPLWAVIAVGVRLSSPGPVLFRQERIGRHGHRFAMIKFRTMVVGSDTPPAATANDCDGGVLFKSRQDPRVTRLGAILRRYSVDELPQLLNVLRGDMALIGPRPALSSEVARYDDDMHRRLAVRPGMTGLWQVSGRSDLAWAEAMRLDLEYVDNWSPWLDLYVLARTGPAVLGHRGAY